MATSTDRTNDTQTILFIDSNVSNYQSLLVGLGSDVEVHLLNNKQDGVSQIAAALQGRSSLDSIQVISHGSSGALSLGSSILNNSNLENYADALRQIGSSLTASGDILLYGCDVAQGNAGVAFINQLASLTGADVAASNDLTGYSALGGDWNLEVSTGKIEAPTLAFSSYDGILANNIPPAGTDDPLIPLSVNQVFTFALAAFGFHDIDSGDTLQNIKITALPSSSVGTLTLNNGSSDVPVTTNQIISVTDINNGLLKFTPTNNAKGIATVVFQVSDGTDFSLSSNTLTFNVGVNHAPILTTTNLITNGSFEQGLNNWTINDLASPLTSVRTLASGLPSQWFSLTATPTDGNYVLENGFDGGGGTIAVTQAVTVPGGDNDLILNFDYRSAWDMQTYSGSTLPRSFHVDIQTSNATGATVLQSTTYLTASQNTNNNDTGISHGTMNLSGYGGQTVYVSFKWDVPQFYTGPADFQLDNVKLLPAHHVLSISTPIILDNTIQVHDIELDALNNYGGASITLARHGGANSEDVFGYSGFSVDGNVIYLSGASVGTININSVGTLTITFANGTTQAQVQSVLSSITYSNTSSTPTTPIAIDWIFSDGNTGAQGIGNALTTIGTTIVDIAGGEHAPAISSPYLNQGIAYGKTWSFGSHFTDPDGKALTYTTTVTGGNGDLTINVDSTGILSATPSVKNFGKTYSVHITATDTGGLSTSADFTVSVLNFDAGNLFFSTSGNDVFNGVGSNNTVSYANSPTPISASLLNHTVVGDGTDTLNGIENLIGSNYADTLTGDANDVLAGGLGNDTYIINNSNTPIIETSNGGKDSVSSSVSYTLPTYVENLTLAAGAGNINAIGNNAANVLIGNDGDNILDGRGGIDTMQGSAGNDTYIVDNIHDVIYEDSPHGGSGIDTVLSSVTYTLPRDVENLTLTGRSAINGTGNNLNNVIIGNAGNNKLSGGDGNDYISGGAGNDKLIGGAGADTLIGGSGKNVYIYNAASESTLGSIDTIIGTFNGGTADTIQLNSTSSPVVVIPSQIAGLSSSALNVTNLNSLLNSTTGTAATKFTNSKVNVAILTTTENKTFFAIDIDGDGTFTSGDMLMDVTGSTLTSVTSSTFKLSSASITPPVPHITLTASASSVDEGSLVTYTVTSDMPAPLGGLSIPYSLSGTATNGTDYTGSASTGTITIAAGATSATLPLNIVADTLTEGSETITMTLGTLSSGIIDNGYGSVTTIVNDTSLSSSAQPASLAGVTLSLDAASDTGVSSTDRITSNNTPSITLSSLNGIAMVAGQQIQILNGSAPSPVAMYTVQASDLTNGVWNQVAKTIPISSPLADGTHTLTAVLVNLGANPTPSAGLNVTIDTVPPVATATAQTIENTGNAIVQSDEIGTAYLINSTLTQPTTEAAANAAISTTSHDATSIAIQTAGSINIPATGLIDGTYKVYTADTAGNFSAAAANVITIATVIGQNFVLTTGADNIIGTSGNDTISGDNTTFQFGTDTIGGGSGTDTLNVGTTGTAFTIAATDNWTNISSVEKIVAVANTVADSIVLGSTAATAGITTVDLSADTATTGNIIDVSVFSSSTNATLIGSTTGATSITGGAGNDTITGGSGNDTLSGGMGTNSITGGAGDDTFNVIASGVDNINDFGNGTDILTVAAGGTANVMLYGTTPSFTATAATTITGTAGFKTATGTTTATIDLSAITTASGTVTIDASNVSGVTLLKGMTASAATGVNIIKGGSGNDVIVDNNIQTQSGTGDSVTGGNGDDTITMVAGTGLTTLDTIDGGAGNDTLILTGNNAITATDFDHVSNIETITLANTNTPVTITTVNTLVASGATLTLSNASNSAALTFIGSAETDGAFNIISGSGNDSIVGGSGADTITSGGGIDTLTGGTGSDTFIVNAGTATITDWGVGIDTLSIAGSATAIIPLPSTGGTIESFANITNGGALFVDGSGMTGAATITGSTGSDSIVGGSGADSITSGGGSDTLTGGAGSDTFNVNAGNATITDLGNGTDTVLVSTGATANAMLYSTTPSWTASVSTVNAGTFNVIAATGTTTASVDMSAVTTNTGTINIDASAASGVTTLKGASAGNSVIVGGTAADTITSGGGNDTLTGGAGSDMFVINAGTATITDWGVGTDSLSIASGATAKIPLATAGGVSESFASITNNGALFVDGSAMTGAATITGSTGSDSIVGGSGADTITSGGGIDTLTGGAGSDTFIVNAGTATITDFLAGTDTLNISSGATAFVSTSATANYSTVANSGILAITVTTAGTTITGSSGTGSDSITGSTGADTIIGGNGANTIIGNGGNDLLIGGTGADTITGGSGSDTIVGGGGADSITTGGGNDVIDIMNHAALSIVTINGGNIDDDTLDIVGGTLAAPASAGDIVDADFANISSIENLMIESTVNAGTITLGSNAKNADISTINAASSGITKIDASSFGNKGLTITGGTATTTITGGSGADIINVKNVAATITGGAGNDTINLTASHTGADTIALDTSSKDTVNNFIHGIDIIQLGGTTPAVAKTVTQIAASTESASITLAGFSSAAVGTITIAGLTVTSDGTSAFTAADIGSVLAGGSVAGLTLSGAVSGYTIGSNSNGTIIFTSTTAATNVTDLSASVTGAAVAPTITITQGGTTYAGVAHEVIFDTAANLGALGAHIGDQRAATNVPHYAVASDSGAIYYDNDGNWADVDTKQIGVLVNVTGLAIGDFTTV